MKMNQILPQMQELQQKATNARLSGNQLECNAFVSNNLNLSLKFVVSREIYNGSTKTYETQRYKSNEEYDGSVGSGTDRSSNTFSSQN